MLSAPAMGLRPEHGLDAPPAPALGAQRGGPRRLAPGHAGQVAAPEPDRASRRVPALPVTRDGVSPGPVLLGWEQLAPDDGRRELLRGALLRTWRRS